MIEIFLPAGKSLIKQPQKRIQSPHSKQNKQNNDPTRQRFVALNQRLWLLLAGADGCVVGSGIWVDGGFAHGLQQASPAGAQWFGGYLTNSRGNLIRFRSECVCSSCWVAGLLVQCIGSILQNLVDEPGSLYTSADPPLSWRAMGRMSLAQANVFKQAAESHVTVVAHVTRVDCLGWAMRSHPKAVRILAQKRERKKKDHLLQMLQN